MCVCQGILIHISVFGVPHRLGYMCVCSLCVCICMCAYVNVCVYVWIVCVCECVGVLYTLGVCASIISVLSLYLFFDFVGHHELREFLSVRSG